MSSPPEGIDKAQARRAFSKAAPRYDDVAVLQREIGNRMLERLEWIKLEPRVVLDAGAGTGLTTEGLLRRYPKSQVIALDFALPMLQLARKRGRLLRLPRRLRQPRPGFVASRRPESRIHVRLSRTLLSRRRLSQSAAQTHRRVARQTLHGDRRDSRLSRRAGL